MVISSENAWEYGLIYDHAKAPYVYAANQLKIYFQKVCGFTLADYNGHKHFICIGDNEQSKNVTIGELKTDGFVLTEQEGNLYILAHSMRACIYGVYEFIERALGVRWFNADGELALPKDCAVWTEEELRCQPYFEQREYMINPTLKGGETAMRMRFFCADTDEDETFDFQRVWYDKISSSHTSFAYVPKEKYYKQHPEFYYSDEKGFNEELCYANGITDDGNFDESKENSVARAVSDSLISFIADSPKTKYFMYGRQDNRLAMCHCEKCEERRKKYGNEAGVMIVFLNAVIKRTLQELESRGLPNHFKVVTFAYQMTVNPPVDENFQPVHPLVVPHEKLCIRYAPIEADYTYSLLDLRQKKQSREQILGWTNLTRNLMLWDYHCNYIEYCWYFPNLSYMKENLELYARSGMIYVTNQSAYNINRDWQADMKAYIASKLYWNLSLDVRELLEEYVYGYYGIAGDKVLAFIDKMEDFFAEKIENGLHIEILGLKHDYFNPKEYPKAFLEECYHLLKSAITDVENSTLSKAEKETLKIRLYRVLLTPMRMLLRNEDFYYPNGANGMDTEFLTLADKVGLKKFGESVSIYVDMVTHSQCDYQIVLGQNPTDTERQTAGFLIEEIEKTTGCTLSITSDDKVFPHYGERAICVGKNTMFDEFFKGSVKQDEYEYYVELCGKCAFVAGTGNLLNGAKVFLEQLRIERENGQVNVKIPFIKKSKKR